MSTQSKTFARPAFAPAKPRAGILAVLDRLLAISRERHALRHLDDHLLDDIGYTRQDAEKEARRPAWDAPDRWLR